MPDSRPYQVQEWRTYHGEAPARWVTLARCATEEAALFGAQMFDTLKAWHGKTGRFRIVSNPQEREQCTE
jgi:predicted LPLAT superfamily acyltransferase